MRAVLAGISIAAAICLAGAADAVEPPTRATIVGPVSSPPNTTIAARICRCVERRPNGSCKTRVCRGD
jgi:hypothetical protein